MKPLAKLAYHTVTVMVGVAWISATITMGVAKFQEEMASSMCSKLKLSLLSREKIRK